MEIDGGVTKKSAANAPKHIESTDIIKFSVEMSTVADAEEDEYCGYVYNIDAVLENGAVKGEYKCRDRYGDALAQSFSESVEFMQRLHSIINEYDFARYNGEYCFVAGLPDNYGALVDIKFASGEQIYASDNETNFIPREAVIKLVDLFKRRDI